MSFTPLPPTSGSPSYRRQVSSEVATDRVSTLSQSLALTLLFLFGVLLASFPIRHTDLWFRLAHGRDLVQGQWDMSHYPTNIRWGWLFNVGAWAIHQVAGGGGLVGCKAVLVGIMAVLMFQLARRRGGLWLPAIVVAFCLLPMSQRLPVQPITLSCFFVVLTYWGIPRERSGAEQSSRPRELFLPVLFLVWAQIDSRVLVGWAMVALTWLGGLMDRRRHDQSEAMGEVIGERPGNLSWKFVLVLFVTAWLNPVFLRELKHGEVWALLGYDRLTRVVTSPFESSYFMGPGQYPAGWSYHVVLILGAGRFIYRLFNTRISWWHGLGWLGLSLASAWEVVWVPLWAAWSGPVLGQEAIAWLVERLPPGPAWNWKPLRMVAACWLVGLIVCAWPGWLQGPPYEPRRWGLDLPESAEQTAALLAEWQASGRLPPGAHGLHLHADTTAAVAWFCPGIKAQWDRMLADRLADPTLGPDELRSLMLAADAHYLVVADPDRRRLLTVVERLLADPKRWSLLSVVGDVTIFGWRDSPSTPSNDWKGKEWDMDEAAFARPTPVPSFRGTLLSDPLALRWRAFTVPAVTRTADRDSAILMLLLAEGLRRQSPVWHLTAWEASQLGAAVGTASAWGTVLAPLALTDGALRCCLYEPPLPEGAEQPFPALVRQILAWQQAFTQTRDDTPSALIYLALRAARRAVAMNPADARSYLVLGESYLRLMHSTRERSWRQRVPELGDLRRAQASFALNQAITLEPELAQAHFHLGALYTEMGYLDLAVEHRRRYLELLKRGPLPADVNRQEFQESLERADRELAQLDRRLREVRDEWQKEAAGKRVGDRAELAARRGLAGEALRTLLESDVSAFGTPGLRLELRLLLGTGKAHQVIDAMEPDQQAVLGTLSYHWTRAEAFAALGDYDAALEECARLADPAGGNPSSGEGERAIISIFVSRAVTEGIPFGKSSPSACLAAQQQIELLHRAVSVVNQMRQRADAFALKGLLALEAGQRDLAEKAVRQSLMWGLSQTTGSAKDGDFRAWPVARTLTDWLKVPSP